MPHRHHRNRQRPRRGSRRGHAAARRVPLVAVVAMCLAALAPARARANTYTGLLHSGVVSASSSGNLYPANTAVSGTVHSWSAPSGVQFNGFAYTAASFGSANEDDTGGLSSGFMGSGGSAPTDLAFPWTTDCSISQQAPRTWIADGVAVTKTDTGPGGVAPGACNTHGNTSGWNYTNVEVESPDTSVNPQSPYQTLTLSIWCARDADCSGGDSANYSVTNLSGSFSDSQSQPAGSLSWNTPVSAGSWYQTQSGGLAVAYAASDPAGICSLELALQGPSTPTSGLLGNHGPGVVNAGGQIGWEFQNGTDPCWAGQANAGTWTLPGGLASGSYEAVVAAANPGNYQAQGFSASGSPEVAATGAIQIDDQAPQLAWSNPQTGWTSQASETLAVTVGPSGLAGLSCTDNGQAVTPALSAGVTGGAGTTYWTIPTAVNGSNDVTCTASNGDANGALTGAASGSFSVDTVVPTITFQDPGYTPGSWTDAAQTVTVMPQSGPSGLQALNCSLDGLKATISPSNQVTISGNSPSATQPHVLSCYATSVAGVSNEANPSTFAVAIDTNQPTISFSGAAANGSWISGTPTVVVTGGEQNATTGQAQILSGIASIACTDNGNQISTPPLSSGFVTSFELTTNGANHIACVPVTKAGMVGSTFTETVNVENPGNDCTPTGCSGTQWGSSPLIDAGADPYSNGPSQSTWSRTAQAVTITADLPAGQAPVASISCSGALTGTWPLSNLNADAAGGERITITVPPPGGQLTCTAADAAGNVYQLGSYQFEEDAIPPAGSFDNLSATTPDDIGLTVYDPGGPLASGVAYVRVYATNTATGSVYDLGLARQASNGSDLYTVNLDDADVPAGTYEFSAQVGDVAGNTAQLTAGPQGTTTVWELPLRDNTSLTVTADGVNGSVDSAIPPALQPDLPNTSTTLAGVGSVLQPVGLSGLALGHALNWLPAAHDRGGPGADLRARQASHQAARGRRCPAQPASARRRSESRGRTGTGRIAARSQRCETVPHSPALTVGYGQRLTLSGTLHNLKLRGAPVTGAPIEVWAQVAGGQLMLLGRTRTNTRGQYHYTVGPGATRSVYVTYAGTPQLRAAVSQLQERFTGRATLDASPAAAGQRLTLTGRVLGGHVPAHGLNVTVEGKIIGYPGSQQLGTVHSTSRGIVRYSIRLPAATRGLRYQLWLEVSARLNPGWPFLGARSPALTRYVS